VAAEMCASCNDECRSAIDGWCRTDWQSVLRITTSSTRQMKIDDRLVGLQVRLLGRLPGRLFCLFQRTIDQKAEGGQQEIGHPHHEVNVRVVRACFTERVVVLRTGGSVDGVLSGRASLRGPGEKGDQQQGRKYQQSQESRSHH